MTDSTQTESQATPGPAPTPSTSPGAGAGSAARTMLRGMSFDAQVQMLTPGGGRGTSTATPIQKSDAEAPDEDDASLGNEPVPYDTPLDEVLGDEGFEGLLDESIEKLRSAATRTRASLAGSPRSDLEVHPDGALALAQSMDVAAAELVATAEIAPDGEIIYDCDLDISLRDAMDRSLDAVEILDAIWLTMNSAEVRAIAGFITALGKYGDLKLQELCIKARSGIDQLEMLVKMFQEHQALFIDHRNDAAQDAVSLAMGPIAEAGKAGVNMKEVWDGYQASQPINDALFGDGLPKNAWDAAKALKSIAMPAADIALEGATAAFKSGFAVVGLLLDLCETAGDLGLATGELLVMNKLLQEAKRVKAEYGTIIAFFEAHAAAIPQALKTLRAMQAAAPAAEALIAQAEQRIDTTWAEGAVYEPV